MAQTREMQTCACGFQHDWKPTFAKHVKGCEVANAPKAKPATKVTPLPVVSGPSLLGKTVILMETAVGYSTGGLISPRLHGASARVLKVNPTGKHVLLDRPVRGWVSIDHITY